MAACPVRVIPASEESKGVPPWRVGRVEQYAKRFGGTVTRFGDSDEDAGWKWEGFIFSHPALSDAGPEVAYESEWDCTCALLVAIAKELVDEGFGPETVAEVLP